MLVNIINMNKLSFLIWLIAAMTFILSPILEGAEKEDVCLESEPAVVKIKGKYSQKTFPGPPNYESIKNGDRSETQWILKFDNPVCVNRTPQEEFWTKRAILNVKKVTLVLSQSMYKKYESLMLRKVVVTGTLWEAHTAHHRTRILITVKEIYPIKADAP